VMAGLLLPAAGQAEGEPKQVIQRFSDELLAVMKDAKQLGFQGRAARLTPAVEQSYDMPAMTRSALGTAASKASPDQLQQLIQAFSRFTVANYADQFDGWSGESFLVGVPHPGSDSGVQVVPSQIVPKTGQPTEIDYVMHKDGNGNWKIIDVLLEGTVSQMAVRRSEFSSIVRRDGPAGLTQELDRKSEQLASKPG